MSNLWFSRETSLANNYLFFSPAERFIWKRAITSGTPPSARDSHTCSSWRNKIIVIGGEDASDYYLSDVHILDVGMFLIFKVHVLMDVKFFVLTSIEILNVSLCTVKVIRKVNIVKYVKKSYNFGMLYII